MTPLPVVEPLPELIVLSHLRWDFVWQRPQHLVARIAPGTSRTLFVEEPRFVAGYTAPTIESESAGPVTRAWMELPGEERHCGFGDDAAAGYAAALSGHVGPSPLRIVWLYTPMALPIAQALEPDLLVYDVMDDLASFAHAPARLRALQTATLETADVVFTGGRSLQRSVVPVRPDAHCFPSGVDPVHYETARAARTTRPGDHRPVAGYVGVIDERIDLDLLGELAAALPDWDIQMVGPVVKIDPATLPQAPNLHYLGKRTYDELPQAMAGFDVALMPFALNEATRSISPTKTLEYLAAGLPVVSTSVPDVIESFPQVVDIQDGPVEFAKACRRVVAHELADRDRKLRPLLQWHHWDAIADRMAGLLDAASSPKLEQLA